MNESIVLGPILSLCCIREQNDELDKMSKGNFADSYFTQHLVHICTRMYNLVSMRDEHNGDNVLKIIPKT